MTDTCYLCGKQIRKADRSDDHVPPKQVFAPLLRKTYNPDRLVTLPAHAKCNRSYSDDEEYFVWTLAPIALGSPTANAVVAGHAAKFRSGRSRGLGRKVLQEFVRRPSGLHLPHGLIMKKVQGERIHRVAWKIVRGLYYIERCEILPESTRYSMELVEPESRDTPKWEELWNPVRAQPGKGRYPAVFDYKYLHVKRGEQQLHAWGTLFWGRIAIFIAHLPPETEAPKAVHK